ncbi:MAG: tRNA1(Val) (adenine(37)-N6)-methyltransferase [Aureispira sp.]
MKIGTDGVLLGAWANIAQASSILDIGTGTGVLALMAAQRQPTAMIHALEINAAAQEQAHNNFAQSPWKERLQLLPYSIQDYLLSTPSILYDSLICNPPYYPSEQNSFIQKEARRQARSTVTLDFTTLLTAAKTLLAPDGNFSLILPTQEAQQFLTIAIKQGWWIAQEIAVIPREGKASNRVLLELKQKSCTKISQTLTLRPQKGDKSKYSAAFEVLHRDFLLFL